MRQTIVTWEERYEACDALLTALALAVKQMRDLQKSRTPYEPMQLALKRSTAEDRVDELVELHLLPPIPPQ